MEAPLPLDVSMLNELSALGGAEGDGFLQKLVARYEETARSLTAEIAAARGRGDRAAIQRAAHKFKGSSANLGLPAVAAECEKIQAWARGRQDFGELDGNLAGLATALETSLLALRDYLTRS